MDLLAAEPWKVLTSEIVLSAVAVKGGAVAAAVALLGVLIRNRSSAATRSALWAAGFGVLLLLPLLVPALAHRVAPALELGLAQYPEGLFRAESGAGQAAGADGLPLAVWLGIAWAAGAVTLGGRFALHLARIARVSLRATPVREGPLADAAREAAEELGVGYVRVALSDSPGVPLTWGLFRPVVLLPREASEWTVSLGRAVLRHEVAHVARMDYLGLLAMELARAIHWPNPLVWYLARQYRMDQERACDDAAIRSGIAASDYARHLVAVARTFAARRDAPLGALPIVRRSTLARRVRAVMDRSASRRPATGVTVAASLLMTAALSVSLAMANPWACTDEKAENRRAGAVEPAGTAGDAGGPSAPKFLSLAAVTASRAETKDDVESPGTKSSDGAAFPTGTVDRGETCTESS